MAFDRPLYQALVPIGGVDVAHDAAAEAFAYAWQHWSRISVMQNPRGYVYAVARNAARRASAPVHVVRAERTTAPADTPEFEPGLVRALSQLSEMQRSVVYLVDGCDWGLTETADLLGVSVSTVRNHRSRGMKHLRAALEVDGDG